MELTAMKAKLAVLLLALPLALSVLAGCTVVYDGHPRPYRAYYWR
jgi:hypothetical protein